MKLLLNKPVDLVTPWDGPPYNRGGRIIPAHDSPCGVDIHPGEVFEAPDGWYNDRKHWHFLQVVTPSEGTAAAIASSGVQETDPEEASDQVDEGDDGANGATTDPEEESDAKADGEDSDDAAGDAPDEDLAATDDGDSDVDPAATAADEDDAPTTVEVPKSRRRRKAKK